MNEKTRLEEKAAPFYLACIAKRHRSGKSRNLRFLAGFGGFLSRVRCAGFSVTEITPAFPHYLQPHS